MSLSQFILKVLDLDRYNDWLRAHDKPTLNLQWLYLRAKDEQLLCGCDFETAMLIVIKTFIMNRSKDEIVLTPPRYDRRLYKKGITFRYSNI